MVHFSVSSAKVSFSNDTYTDWFILYLCPAADFGFARYLQSNMMAATLCGSPMYMVSVFYYTFTGVNHFSFLGFMLYSCSGY